MTSGMRVRYCIALTTIAAACLCAANAQDKLAPLNLENRQFTESLQNSTRDQFKAADAVKQRREKDKAAATLRRLQFEENAAALRDEVQKFPTTPFYYRRLLYALKRIGRCDEIFEVAHQLLLIEPLDTYALSTMGTCYYERGRYDKAIEYLEPSACYNPSDFQTDRTLGYCFYRLHRYAEATGPLETAVSLQPDDFPANYWLGCSLMNSGKLSAAVEPLGRAARLHPTDYWANQTSGLVLVRLARYREAVSHLERALALRDEARQTKPLLFITYLLIGEFGKASALFPVFVAITAAALTSGYMLGLVPLLFFSFRRSAAAYPNIFFALGWLVVFMEGQIAFIFLLALVPWLKLIANPIGAVLLAGIPLLAALSGFVNQGWGEPFRWPPRLGNVRVVLTGFLLLLGVYVCNFLLHKAVHSERPLQTSVPIIQEALHNSPLLGYVMIAIAIPAIEEVVFRGLLFGSIRRWLSATWTVMITALLFAAIHLQPAAFVQLFLLGCLLGWARARSGSVALPILLHVLNNSLAVLPLMDGKMQ